MIFLKSILICTGLALALASIAQTSWIFDNDALSRYNKARWTYSGWRNVKITEGCFDAWGTAQSNYLTSPLINIDADKYKYLDIYVDNFGAILVNKLLFSADGKDFPNTCSVNFNIFSYYMAIPQKVTVDLTKNKQWKGIVKRIKIYSPPRSDGTHTRIYGMQFVEKPNYLYNGDFLLQKFRHLPLWKIEGKYKVLKPDCFTGIPVMKLFGNTTLKTELNHFHNGHFYNISFRSKGKISGAVDLYDSKGILLRKVVFKSVGHDGKWQKFAAEYNAPITAFNGKVVLKSTGNGEVCNVHLDYIGARTETWKGGWIWSPDGPKNNQTCFFRKKFTVDKSQVKEAFFQAAADDDLTFYFNGKELKRDWGRAQKVNVINDIENGINIMAAKVFNYAKNAGLIAELVMVMKDGSKRYIYTDKNWLTTIKKPGNSWIKTGYECSGWEAAQAVEHRDSGISYMLGISKNKISIPEALPVLERKNIKYSIDTSLNYPRIKGDNEFLSPFIFGPPWRGGADITAQAMTSARSGFDIYRFWFELGGAWDRNSYNVNMSGFDQKLERLLRINPKAKIIVCFRTTAPPWWMAKYPDELCKYSDGKTDGHYGLLPSMASRKWIDDSLKYITTMVNHIEKSKYADRVIGYMPCSHAGGPEWYMTVKPGDFPDYSKPMLKFFRSYLKRKYKTDEALRKAWKNNKVSIDKAEIPGRDSRGNPAHYFLNPESSQAVFDYNRCHQESVSSAMLEMQKHIKELTGGRRLTFVFYGYITEMMSMLIYPHANGHYDLTRVLNSPYVDSVASPIPYSLRPLGNVSGCNSIVSSYRLHNKIWLNEADIRTNLTEDSFGHKHTYNLKDAVSMDIREFAYALTRRLGIWYFDMTGGWFDNPEFEKTFRTMRKVYDYANQKPISFKSKVAVFFDEHVLDRVSLQRGKWGGNNIKRIMGRFRIGLGKAGTPCDTFMLDDIYKIDPAQYKCYIFLNAWRRNEKLKQYLDEKIRRNGNMIVWIYAPGYSRNKLSLDNMKYMTGLQFGLCRKNTRLEIKTNFYNNFVTGAPGISPPKTFYVKTPEAQVLGRYPQNGKPGLVIMKNKNYSTVYMAAPDDTGKVWSKLFKTAGIHLFCSRNDRIYYDGEFIGIHLINGSGKRTINLDRDVNTAWNIFEDKEVTVKKRKIEISGAAGETKLFYLGKPLFKNLQ